ncbi:MAG: peptidase [Legionellales bacterium RIFCSPHIGHO2_12_FULL_37_14]|nr:MAG: peptidase [Legionellales bacterium RIFCSPHIGHO2_12_FULL_37_14]
MILRLFFCLCLLLSSSLYALETNQLLPNERNTVEIFQQYSPNVVYVHKLATYMNSSRQIFDVAAGSGSGIVWNKEGYIVTNFHVVNGADRLAVSMENATYRAKIIGVDPYKDIAVLRIDPKKAALTLNKIKPFVLAKSSELLVGQKAIAIGNPFGLDHSLSVGVISALGRQVPGEGGVTMHDMIQTDAAINPGNSGGPLLDSKGQLIGMNTAIYSKSGTSAGVSFATSADDLNKIVPEIIKHGRIVMVGIGITRIPAYVAHSLNVHNGVLIADVLPRSPAQKAGLRGTRRAMWGGIQLGDIIVGVDNHPIVNYDALYSYFSKQKVGTKVTLDVLRAGRVFKVKLKTIDIGAY